MADKYLEAEIAECEEWEQREVFEKQSKRYRSDGKRTPNGLCIQMFLRSIEPIILLASLGCTRRFIYNFLMHFEQIDYGYQTFCKQLKRYEIDRFFHKEDCLRQRAKSEKNGVNIKKLAQAILSKNYIKLFEVTVENLPKGITWPHFKSKKLPQHLK